MLPQRREEVSDEAIDIYSETFPLLHHAKSNASLVIHSYRSILDPTPFLKAQNTNLEAPIGEQILIKLQPRLQQSSRMIQASLERIKNFEHNKRRKKAFILTTTTLTLMSCYFAFVYSSIKFFKQKYPSLYDYLDTHTNGSTCGKLFPIKNNICNFLDTNKIPAEAPLALYCANILWDSFLPNTVWSYNTFLNMNCSEFFPGINFANLTGLAAALIDCMQYDTWHYNNHLTYAAYLNVTTLLNGVSVLCNDVLYFANETAYDAFFNSKTSDCWAYASDVTHFYKIFYNQYNSSIGQIGSCAENYPIHYNFSLGMENIYRAIPGIEPCYKKTLYDDFCYDHYFSDDWMSVGRVGIILLGIGIAAFLLALSYYLYRWGTRMALRTYHFNDLNTDDRAEANHIVQTFAAQNSGPIADNITLAETKALINAACNHHNQQIERVKAFLTPEKKTYLSHFFASKGGKDTTGIIIEHVLRRPC